MDAGTLPVNERVTHTNVNKPYIIYISICNHHVCTGMTVYHWSAIRQTLNWVIWEGTQIDRDIY